MVFVFFKSLFVFNNWIKIVWLFVLYCANKTESKLCFIILKTGTPRLPEELLEDTRSVMDVLDLLRDRRGEQDVLSETSSKHAARWRWNTQLSAY